MDSNFSNNTAKANVALRKALYVLSGTLLLGFLYYANFSPPGNFPTGRIVKIGPGATLRSVSLKLKEEHIIRSRTAFEAFIILFDREKGVVSTDYYFERPLPVFIVAARLASGENNIAPVVVTIPEGFDNEQIADALAAKLPAFNRDNFLAATHDLQGYLFPDTYFFLVTDTAKTTITSMQNNFNKKINPLLPEIAAGGKSESDIITMASIIEREAKNDLDRGPIAGILWRRLALGMPLQVDAAPETYKTKGLPKAPISNPGLPSIRAAIHPDKSPYLYYLHDPDGNIHYARTFAEHIANQIKYLGKKISQ